MGEAARDLRGTAIREARASDAQAWARLRAELRPTCSHARHELEIRAALEERRRRTCGFRKIASDAEIGNEESILLHGRRGSTGVGRTVHVIKSL